MKVFSVLAFLALAVLMMAPAEAARLMRTRKLKGGADDGPCVATGSVCVDDSSCCSTTAVCTVKAYSITVCVLEVASASLCIVLRWGC